MNLLLTIFNSLLYQFGYQNDGAKEKFLVITIISQAKLFYSSFTSLRLLSPTSPAEEEVISSDYGAVLSNQL